jgi:hypothetical protein
MSSSISLPVRVRTLSLRFSSSAGSVGLWEGWIVEGVLDQHDGGVEVDEDDLGML